ncbi:ABC transporter ATP-binding protein [Acrocarpospora macrocephala]|uniref:Peptide ABC transporter ATP-binding protein n=1 Tax=Acrocarpospora macrocephala TaxID=150177 RepID=A0A5M3WPM2_9ACTN|nr:ABC transporter ATP-binding protein [Acrocarpospora macrocephala]GES10500.1 peptide ABC transporter ATP-binding protein [Acrocarpospora macrocephala]
MSAETGSAAPVLAATDLVIEYSTRNGPIRSLDQATLTVGSGQIVALVGESGSGKSTLGMATGRLLASNAVYAGGLLSVAGRPVYGPGAQGGEGLRALRREVLAFVFQNPVAALNPTMRIRRQMELAGPAGREARDGSSAAEALGEVGLTDVPRVLRSYPHELSGGMAQRVGIAMALRRRPRLLIADEPTAAVDATLRAQILNLLVSQCRDQGCALLLLTHDLHAVAQHTEQIAVMYGGRMVEHGPTAEVLGRPMHPYTRALVAALPGEERPGRRLEAIGGVPPVLHAGCPGCAFAPRCPDALPNCRDVRPADAAVAGRTLTCHLHPGEIGDPSAAPNDAGRPRATEAGRRHLDKEQEAAR